jgi:predicted AlkP superfamily phosphohydrolase/phosphomutase
MTDTIGRPDMGTKRRKAVVIGLDCATPEYVFGECGDALPTLRALRDRGVWGTLESCIPPITCPAWMCMATSRDPGELGLYGFRNRSGYDYGPLRVPDSSAVTVPTVWEVASDHGLRPLVVGVPLTYPPKPLNGVVVSGFLTPGTDVDYTYPSDVREEIHDELPNYDIDVTDFRTDDKGALLDRLYETTRRHFSALEILAQTHAWELAWFVDMGVDRIQHAFWHYSAPDHRLHEPGNPYENVIARYYRYIDGCIGRLLAIVPQDAIVLVVSDHGARTLRGAVCINDWLIEQGLLSLRARPAKPTPLRPEMIDWSRTKVWAEGGYYARLFVNVAGREPSGIVPPDDYDALLAELTAKLEAMTDARGAPLQSRAFRPDQVYRDVNGCPPDLMVYLGDLAWRSAGTVGNPAVLAVGNDTGPDEANHAQNGVFILADPGEPDTGCLEGVRIYDIAPTLLERLGLPIPAGAIGRPISGARSDQRRWRTA